MTILMSSLTPGSSSFFGFPMMDNSAPPTIAELLTNVEFTILALIAALAPLKYIPPPSDALLPVNEEFTTLTVASASAVPSTYRPPPKLPALLPENVAL